jgi:tetratricopeptide (TPR) repeat protein
MLQARCVRTLPPRLLSCVLLSCVLLSAAPVFLVDEAQAASVAEVQSMLKARNAGVLAAAEALVKAEPKNAEAWIVLTQARIFAKRYEKAVEAGEKAVELAPKNAQSHYWLGNALGNRIGQVGMVGKMTMAPDLRDAFEQAVKLDPALIDARSSLIEFYLQAPSAIGGGIDKAKAQVAAIGKYDRAAGLRAQMRLAMHEKNWGQAIKFGEAAVALKPDDSAMRQQLVVLYQQAKRWPDAYAAVKKWIAEAPKSNNAQYQLGRLAAESGQYLPEGEAALRMYLKMPREAQDPQPKSAHYRLGQVLAKAGRKDEARVALQAALKLDPSMKEAKEALAAL